MNIFILDNDMTLSAQYHCDKHVLKLATEGTQILCTAIKCINADSYTPYASTHINHPCSVWARTSMQNWLWLYDFVLKLCHEYTYRYERVSETQKALESISCPNLPDTGLTEFAVCIKEYPLLDTPVASYRNYYIGDKHRFAKWTKRDIPEWYRNAFPNMPVSTLIRKKRLVSYIDFKLCGTGLPLFHSKNDV